jgi:hypothetical protein
MLIAKNALRPTRGHAVPEAKERGRIAFHQYFITNPLVVEGIAASLNDYRTFSAGEVKRGWCHQCAADDTRLKKGRPPPFRRLWIRNPIIDSSEHTRLYSSHPSSGSLAFPAEFSDDFPWPSALLLHPPAPPNLLCTRQFYTTSVRGRFECLKRPKVQLMNTSSNHQELASLLTQQHCTPFSAAVVIFGG